MLILGFSLDINVVPVKAYIYTTPNKKKLVLTALKTKYFSPDSLDNSYKY